MIRILRKLTQIWIMIDLKQPENIKYFKYIGSMITTDARHTLEFKSSIAVEKEALNKMKALSPENWAYYGSRSEIPDKF